MRYGDLFTLNPITTVIQLNQADEKDKARDLVARFVFTPTLAEQFDAVLLPQLKLNSNTERKGIFVVGNYGTGKSHVMSFISALAEHADLVDAVRDSAWRDKLAAIAGSYCVHRCQIAGSKMELYGIVTHELQAFAVKNGFSFQFKPQEEVVNVKTEFARFQAAFESHHPGKGILLVVDELLHHLEGRDDQNLVLDLSVLQSLGEFCEGARFLFMAGLQQKLFENSKFAHVSNEIRRIRQRFNDFVIDSKGVAQLIENYLFVKDASQKDKIRTLLSNHAELYPLLAGELEKFVSLFPAHPRFIDEFQRVSVAERREILTTLTRQAQERIDHQIEDGQTPRLITADDYWRDLETDQGLRTSQDILSVIKNVETLSAKIETGFEPQEDKNAALRLVRALGVNRLTTPEISSPVGLTPQSLVEDLLWYSPIPIQDAEFMGEEAKRLLGRVRDVANGQFLAESKTSGQFYIDPKLDRDYPHEVETRAATVSPTVAQRYLNTLFTRLLEIDNTLPVMEGRLWQYDLLWKEHNVERRGWLFFGFPSQRLTARPPRDFYLFFVPSQAVSGLEEVWTDAPDEIYFQLETLPDDFLQDLKRFAAASERGRECHPGDEKRAFESIAAKLLQSLQLQLAENASGWFEARWNGERKTLASWLGDVAPAQKSALFKTKIEAVAGHCLEGHFANRYPGYPKFKRLQTETNRSQGAQSAVETLCKNGLKSELGLAVLNALELFDDDVATTDRSPWLQKIKARLDALEPGQVLNHADLFEKRDERLMMKDGPLEAEWLHIVLVAGVEAGVWTMTGPQNTRFDAGRMNELWTTVKGEPEKVIAISRPQNVDIGRWRQLFGLLALAAGPLANANTHAAAVDNFQKRRAEKTAELVDIEARLRGNLPALREASRAALDQPLARIGRAKTTLESLQGLNSKARMANLNVSDEALGLLKTDLEAAEGAARLIGLLASKKRELDALERFRSILNADVPFQAAYRGFEDAVNAAYADPGPSLQDAEIQLDAAVKRALSSYSELKARYSLNHSADKRKKELLESRQLSQLNKLHGIDVVNRAALETVREQVGRLPIFKPCTDDELLDSPTSLCPHTGFDPRAVPPALQDRRAEDVLDESQVVLDGLHREWTAQLLGELESPAIKPTLQALKDTERKRVDDFVRDRALPDDLDAEWVRVINTALRGLKRKAVRADDFARAVLGDGAPLKIDELRERFEKWLKEQTSQEPAESVRFALEDRAP